MSDQSGPERERLQRVDLPKFPGDEGPVRRAVHNFESGPLQRSMAPRSYEEEVALYREGKLAGEPAFDPPPPHVNADAAMLERWRAHRTGLAPYYPLLYSLVIGMGAQRVFEFGTGESTEVLLSALRQTDGVLYSCSPSGKEPSYADARHWVHYPTLSEHALRALPPEVCFDLVLHDGSHSAAVVEADLIGILPRVKRGGLILLHDTLHSYVGAQVRSGLREALLSDLLDGATTTITLPFAFGLTVIQVIQFESTQVPYVSIGPEKASSPHHTERMG